MNTKNLHPEIEKLKSLAINAYRGTSFDPEKRGEHTLTETSKELYADIETITEHDGDVDRYTSKYVSMCSDWLGSRGRCMSAMITGPARFPVEKNKRRFEIEQRKWEAFREWRQKALRAITKPESDIIRRGDAGAVQKLEAKLADYEKRHKECLSCNKISRSKKLSFEDKVKEISEILPKMPVSEVENFIRSGWGFGGYARQIRELKKDIEAEKRREEQAAGGNKERMFGDVKVVQNFEANRLQIIFPDQPDQETRRMLSKDFAFKWSPKNGAWQRQLTNNAMYAMKMFLKRKELI